MKVKKLIEKIQERLSVEYIKLLFLIDKQNDELLELGPGETQGEQGLALAVIITDLVDAANHLSAASERLQKLLRRAEDEEACESNNGDIVGGIDDDQHRCLQGS